jgi:biopolymer transport protein ExbB/TolQ
MHLTRSYRRLPEWPLLVLALALVGSICIPLWHWNVSRPDGEQLRMATMLLGPEQLACYAAFLWAGLILLNRALEVRRQRRVFELNLLPNEEGSRVLPEDALPLQRRVDQLSERSGPYVLTQMIRLALSKFAISRSPQDAGETIRAQADVEVGRMSATLATVHYLAWAIPAIGFVGTVRGIGMALQDMGALSSETLQTFVKSAGVSLAIAFDTTLVALILSLILMFFLHAVQRDEEALVLECQQYCLEGLVSRLYDMKPAATELPVEKALPDYSKEGAWPL